MADKPTIAVQAPPPATQEPEKQPSLEKIAEFAGAMFEDKPKKEAAPTPPVPATPPTEPAPPKPPEEPAAPQTPPAKKEKPKKRAVAPREPDHSEEIEELRQEVEALKEPPKPEPKPESSPTPTSALDLSYEELEDLAAIEHLESKDPAHKGLRDKVVKFLTEQEKYIAAWEREHPGEVFDDKQPEHDAFYAKHEPKDYQKTVALAKRAMVDDRIERAVDERVKRIAEEKINPAVERLEYEQALKQHQPAIAQMSDWAVAELLAESDDEFAKLVRNEDGTVNYTQEVIDKLVEINPEVVDLVNEQAGRVRVLVEELQKMNRLRKFHRFDKDKTVEIEGTEIYPHRELAASLRALEQRISAASPEAQLQGGRKFVTTNEYAAMMQAVEKKNLPADRKQVEKDRIDARVWTVTPGDISDFIVTQSARKVRDVVKKAEKLAERRINKTAKPAENPPAPKPQQTPAETESQRAPALKSPSDSLDNTGGRSGNASKPIEKFAGSMW